MKLELSLVDSAMNDLIDKNDLRDSKGARLNWKKLENGSCIMVRGLSNTEDPDTIRGFKAKVIVIDEFFHMNDQLLAYMQDEVLSFMQADYGTEYVQLLIGTPPKRKGSYGSVIWDTWNIPKFRWTMFDNPYEPDPEGFIDQMCAEKGITRDHPYIRREAYGEDVFETDWLLYPVYSTYNMEDTVPSMTIDLVTFGVDYGTSASNALVGVAWDTVARRGFVWKELKFTMAQCPEGMTVTETLKQEARQAWAEAFSFFPNMTKQEANARIYWGADTSHKATSQDLVYGVRMPGEERMYMNLADAHKTDRLMMIDKIRDLFRTEALLLPEDGLTAQECELTVLRKLPNGEVDGTGEIDDKIYHPDLLPALRYAMWYAVGQEVRQ